MASTSFSIHQERWQDVWVAATAAVRARKKQQVSFDIHHRVDELLEEFGPQSDRPLTLRVYGTMMKGFCVLNNERTRALYSDAERVVVMFSQRPFVEGDQKLPPAKRQRTDALALDLDLAKVPESEMFNWSQAPWEDAALLQLDSSIPLTLLDALALPQPSLLEDARLLDESFPPIDMQAIVPLDAAAEAVRMAEAAEAAAAASNLPSAMASAVFPPVAEVLPVQNAPEAIPPPSIADLIASIGDVDISIAMPVAEPGYELQMQRRAPRKPPQLPGAGHVYGFDEDTQLQLRECDEWQLHCDGIGGRYREPEEFAYALLEKMPEPDRLGMLHAVLDPLSDAAAMQRMFALSKQGVSPLAVQDGSMPEVQALLASDQAEPGSSQAAMTHQVEELKDGHGSSPMTCTSDPFRPYVPYAPLSSMQGADMELAGVLGGKSLPTEELFPQNDGPPQDDGDSNDETEARYDDQTAQVASILHRYMERTAHDSRKITLDDLIPPSSTDKEVAARTFLAVLTLATAGDFQAQQMQPYGPITVAVP